MDLTVHRDRPRMVLRIWTGAEGPLSLPPECLAVEWAGRIGHPSSYALLGGSLAHQPETVLGTGRLRRSLANGLDTVQIGLPAEYRDAVRSVTERLQITAAAHGEVGSSPSVFSRVATLLVGLLEDGVPDSEDALWQLWDESGG